MMTKEAPVRSGSGPGEAGGGWEASIRLGFSPRLARERAEERAYCGLRSHIGVGFNSNSPSLTTGPRPFSASVSHLKT